MVAAVRALNNDFAGLNGFFARLSEIVATWKARSEYRRELAQISFHEIQDLGVDQAALDHELAKPFWVE